MNFIDGSLFPENQEKLVITVAPYGPEWMPSDFSDETLRENGFTPNRKSRERLQLRATA
jgi:hypothetical protein